MQEAKYIKGSTNVSQAPSDLPIFLLLGRSNVGKSSFINSLTNRKALARTSGTPGKTIALNYYLINDSFYIVDAPGYGYARRSKSTQDEFILMIENILMHHPNIVSVLLLIDFKVGPTKDDLDIYEFLKALNHPLMVIATKKDKINKTKQHKHERLLKEKLFDLNTFYAISNTNKVNIDKVRKDMLERILLHEPRSNNYWFYSWFK